MIVYNNDNKFLMFIILGINWRQSPIEAIFISVLYYFTK